MEAAELVKTVAFVFLSRLFLENIFSPEACEWSYLLVACHTQVKSNLYLQLGYYHRVGRGSQGDLYNYMML